LRHKDLAGKACGRRVVSERADDSPEAQGGLKDPPWRRARSSGIRSDSCSVVHGDPEFLLESEVALGRLDGGVAEQELDLIQPRALGTVLIDSALCGFVVDETI
jgi:hypothetical protein